MPEENIQSTQQETRLFPPPAAATAAAYVKTMEQYRASWKESIDSPETFWPPLAKELDWTTPWARVLDWNVPDAKWFVGGRTNLAAN